MRLPFIWVGAHNKQNSCIKLLRNVNTIDIINSENLIKIYRQNKANLLLLIYKNSKKNSFVCYMC